MSVNGSDGSVGACTCILALGHVKSQGYLPSEDGVLHRLMVTSFGMQADGTTLGAGRASSMTDK